MMFVIRKKECLKDSIDITWYSRIVHFQPKTNGWFLESSPSIVEKYKVWENISDAYKRQNEKTTLNKK